MSEFGVANPNASAKVYDPIGVAGGLKITWFDTWFSYFGLIVYADAMADPIRVLRGIPEIDRAGGSDPLKVFDQFLLLVVLGCILVARWRRISLLLQTIVPYLAFIAICILSSIWSPFPPITFRRALVYGGCVMFGVYCYDAFGFSGLVDKISRLAVVLALLSIFFFVAMPSIGVDQNLGTYHGMRGVFPQKNLLSVFMVLAILCRSYSLLATRNLNGFLWSVPLLFLSVLLSHSASSLVITTIVLALTGLLYVKGSRARLLYWYLVMSIGLVVVTVYLFAPDIVFSSLGRDESLTGRLPLWALVVNEIIERPLLGFGFGAFWNADFREAQYIWSLSEWLPPHAHNGYLEVTLEIGLVGLAAAAWIGARAVRLAVSARRSQTLPAGTWMLLFISTVVLLNTDVCELVNPDLFNVMMAASMIELGMWRNRQMIAAKALLQQRLRNAGPNLVTGPRRPATRSGSSVA